jgi:transcriptional/translational regulatory protein YebC/TACO1
VAYLFKSRGVICVDKSAVAEDQLIELVLEAGADDVNTEGEAFEVLTPPAQLEAVKEALVAKGVAVQSAEVTKIASVQIRVSEREAESLLKLVDAFEDHDDVQKVYANFNVPDEVLARLVR